MQFLSHQLHTAAKLSGWNGTDSRNLNVLRKTWSLGSGLQKCDADLLFGRFIGTTVGFLDCWIWKHSGLFRRRETLTERHSVTHSSPKTSTTPLSKPHMSNSTKNSWFQFNPQAVPDYRHTTSTAVTTFRSDKAIRFITSSMFSNKPAEKKQNRKSSSLLNAQGRTTQQNRQYCTALIR
jgi:hypothetical protein